MLLKVLRWCEIPQPYFPGNVIERGELEAKALMQEMPGVFEIYDPKKAADPEPAKPKATEIPKTRMTSGLVKG